MMEEIMGDSKLLVAVLALAVLVVFSAVQTVEVMKLTGAVKDLEVSRISKKSTSTSTPTSLSKNLNQLQGMVGGC